VVPYLAVIYDLVFSSNSRDGLHGAYTTDRYRSSCCQLLLRADGAVVVVVGASTQFIIIGSGIMDHIYQLISPSVRANKKLWLIN
jgi:hypothetical protein